MAKTRTDSFELKPHHCGISVPDLEASIAWYRDMLGISLEKRGAIDAANARIAVLMHGEFCVELLEVAGAAPMPEAGRHPDRDIATHGTKHMAFEVQDLPRFMHTLKEKGVDVAMDLFVMENTLVAFIRDNSGILIELTEHLDRN